MLTVNGKTTDLKVKTIGELILRLEFKSENIAVVKNGKIIKKSEWNIETVNSGDIIEIFSPVSGG